MKINKLGLFLLIVPLAAAAISLFFLPNVIPLHWNDAGEVDREGSKYFIFLLGLLPFVTYMSIKRKYRL